MAVAYANSGTLTSVSSVTSITSPLPATISAGDLLLLAVCQFGGTSGLSWPAGWTQVDQQAWVPVGYSFYAGFAYRIATGADSAPVVTWTGSSTAISQVFRFTGADATPFSAARSFATGATVATHTSPAVITTANNSDVIYLDMSYGTTLLTNPTGWTSDANAAGAALEIALGDKQIAAIGTSSGAISTPGNSAIGWIQWQQEILSERLALRATAPSPTVTIGSLDVVLIAPAPAGISDPDMPLTAPALVVSAAITIFNLAWADGIKAPAGIVLSEFIGVSVTAPNSVLYSDFGTIATLVAPVPDAKFSYTEVALSAPLPVIDSYLQATVSIRITPQTPTLVSTSEYNFALLSAIAPTLDISIPGGIIISAPPPALIMQSYLAEMILIAPALTTSIGFDGGVVLAAPAPQIFTVLFGPADISTLENPYSTPFPAWAINYETSAPSRYDNLPANSMCVFNGKTYMACAAGIYEIGANTDAGRPIHASATVAQTNFANTKNKRIAYIYVGLRSTGAMRLKAIANNQSDRYYALNAIGGAVRGSRANLGKGLEGQYWQFRIDNVNGADFELDTIEFKPIVLSRHGV